MNVMHLNHGQLKAMIKMGHSIGVHTHTHVSVAASKLNHTEAYKELVWPKIYLEDQFSCNVFAFSYPFGERQDCLNTSQFLEKTGDYKLAFTIEEIVNNKETPPLELGRYMPTSHDTDKSLLQKLNQILGGA
ncbi:MAG: hypothetical protein COV29_02160 [Candidatus Yanofskybacteria bacterium CG10_big_fil_rev_8_21_14_0_10_36_16]|uniref:NodB homology domain-containing protein n=1 Tax=Candidatus Yanofskybacteria bacterium CG10_big_fil_rev_8_21_14_0_10_36_16 TaxID=1975096 RepID=A0A2J0Q7K0_9BACT|nr:MAG: hypothetical protein COV29_02160 [Candidatus Yanofskybacteria bacterium CG10_big_fil_rev_8_21_14_0_10_36_16]